MEENKSTKALSTCPYLKYRTLRTTFFTVGHIELDISNLNLLKTKLASDFNPSAFELKNSLSDLWIGYGRRKMELTNWRIRRLRLIQMTHLITNVHEKSIAIIFDLNSVRTSSPKNKSNFPYLISRRSHSLLKTNPSVTCTCYLTHN